MICKSLGLFLFKFYIPIMQIVKPIKKQCKYFYISVLKIFGQIESKLGINFLLIRTYIKSVQKHTKYNHLLQFYLIQFLKTQYRNKYVRFCYFQLILYFIFIILFLSQ
ncbi:unnamed protein product [Paramecium sonneborni]|uniref:Transmembrane protein n=1 Tax=Paramecium sonneborni TaxID=65129 RepID=A0A8S1LM02_9CILI|nr:unnamed protein product [Paramecium sonneborni]